MIPSPPSWAIAIAMSLSVTVSIGLEMIGTWSVMFRVTCEARFTSAGITSL